MSEPTCIDLFAGAGGFSLGFRRSGFNVLYAVDVDPWAAESYRGCFGGVQVDQQDIGTVPDSRVQELAEIGIDVIIGGPPCQGFSQSNVVNRDPKDPRNSLFLEFIRFVRTIRPRLCLIENVKGLSGSRTADGRPVIEVIADCFREVGYSTCPAVLDAARFGVPQRRERLFIAAWPCEAESGFQWPVPVCSLARQEHPTLFDPALKPPVTLWDAISDLPECPTENGGCTTYARGPQNAYQAAMRAGSDGRVYNHEPMRHSKRVVERFSHIHFGQSEENAPGHLGPRRRGSPDVRSGRRYGQNSRRQHPDHPCSTIVASSHTNFIHPFLNRNFTVREMMRVQSFPDDFVLFGKRAVLSRKLCLRKGLLDDVYLDQRMQVGNAVPPLLAYWLANCALDYVKRGKA